MRSYIHSVQLRVLYGDTDSGGVVYNANYLRYFEFGRTEFMRERVCTYREIEQSGFLLPVTETWIRYKAPAHYDDLLTIETMVAELTKMSCTFAYKVVREEPGLERPKLLAKGYTVHAAVDRSGKLMRLPIDITSKIADFVNPDTPAQRLRDKK